MAVRAAGPGPMTRSRGTFVECLRLRAPNEHRAGPFGAGGEAAHSWSLSRVPMGRVEEPVTNRAVLLVQERNTHHYEE
jgi:hypothetical protein